MLWLRKSKKGFTLIELMVVVAIIGILALLGLRLFLMQQVRAKNAIVKANAATVHTIIQGNLADTNYTDAIWTTPGAPAAVADIRNDLGVLLPYTGGTNTLRPAGMKNPHLTAVGDFVVQGLAGKYANATDFLTAADALTPTTTYAGVVIVAEDSAKANKFYVVGLDNDSVHLGEVYIAMK